MRSPDGLIVSPPSARLPSSSTASLVTDALFAAIPLMLGWGEGAELRRPLGLAIFGGLIVSQLLTLFTTPVIYLAFDRLARRRTGKAPHQPKEAGA